MLGARRGRAKILARLGTEASDPLDEFLNLALAYEQRETSSLQGFLNWIRAAQSEVKRDMDIARDEVRVMTVHGAKGLEAKNVILIDHTTTRPEGAHPPRLLTVPVADAPPHATALIWGVAKDKDAGPMAQARAQAIDAACDEYRRLLYVGLTRAADRLLVCGAKGVNKAPTGLLARSCAERAPTLVGRRQRRRRENLALPQGRPNTGRRRLAPDEETDRTATVAHCQGTSRSAGTSDLAAIRYGRRRATLCRCRRHAVSSRFCAGRSPTGCCSRCRISRHHAEKKWQANFCHEEAKNYHADQRAALLREVLLLVENKDFSELFAPGSRAEVPIVGKLSGGVLVSGQVDRLAVTKDQVLIADFKTNRMPPRRIEEVPDAYVKQLAAYRAVLQKLYPDRPVRAALIWTEAPDLMELSADVLDRALAFHVAARAP